MFISFYTSETTASANIESVVSQILSLKNLKSNKDVIDWGAPWHSSKHLGGYEVLHYSRECAMAEVQMTIYWVDDLPLLWTVVTWFLKNIVPWYASFAFILHLFCIYFLFRFMTALVFLIKIVLEFSRGWFSIIRILWWNPMDLEFYW